jgi:hypothetical protein
MTLNLNKSTSVHAKKHFLYERLYVYPRNFKTYDIEGGAYLAPSLLNTLRETNKINGLNKLTR